MKRIFIAFIIMSMILSGCSNSSELEELRVTIQNQLTTIENLEKDNESFKDKNTEFVSAIEQQSKKIEELNNSITLSEEQYEEQDELLKDSIESYEIEIGKMNEEIAELRNANSGLSRYFYFNNMNIDLRYNARLVIISDDSESSDEIVRLIGYLNSNQEEWILEWEVVATEFEPTSGFTITKDGQLFIVVFGTLYAIDISNGEILWTIEHIGASLNAPIVIDDFIYCTTFDPRYVRCISIGGELLWSVNPDEGYEVWISEVEDDHLVIQADSGKYKLDFNGNILK